VKDADARALAHELKSVSQERNWWVKRERAVSDALDELTFAVRAVRDNPADVHALAALYALVE
jgi:hypothetical protein